MYTKYRQLFLCRKIKRVIRMNRLQYDLASTFCHYTRYHSLNVIMRSKKSNLNRFKTSVK